MGWRFFSMRGNRKTTPRATLANALNLPGLRFEAHFGKVAPFLSPTSRIVVYCDGTQCDLSHRVSERLQQFRQDRRRQSWIAKPRDQYNPVQPRGSTDGANRELDTLS